MATKSEKAWAAGLFEGEGCFFLYQKKNKSGRRSWKYLGVCLRMTDQDVVNKFRDVVGCGTIRTFEKPGHKRMYHWQAGSRANSLYVANLLEPWLMSRRRQRLNEIRAELTEPRKAKRPMDFCKRGHEKTVENCSGPRLKCRICKQEYEKQAYARRVGKEYVPPDWWWNVRPTTPRSRKSNSDT